MSDSLRGVTIPVWPGRLRSRSFWISELVRAGTKASWMDEFRMWNPVSLHATEIRGGQPSRTTPIAGPWDSPHVVTLKSFPNASPIGFNQHYRNSVADGIGPAADGADQLRFGLILFHGRPAFACRASEDFEKIRSDHVLSARASRIYRAIISVSVFFHSFVS